MTRLAACAAGVGPVTHAEETTVSERIPDRTADRLPSRLAGLVLGVLLTASSGACTSGPEPDPQPRPSPTDAPSSTPTAGPPSVPMRVKVTRVAGRLSAQRRQALAAQVGRTISAYVDAAFLTGAYPRSSFAGSFVTFTPGAARQARRDQALLTNRPLGPTTRSVRATRRTAYLSVLAPREATAGVTAAVDLVFVVDRGTAAPQRVQVRGRLLLTRDRSGRWKIFGYDVNRSSTPQAGVS